MDPESTPSSEVAGAKVPITDRKLLAKLAFVFREGDPASRNDALQAALYNFAKVSKEKRVSRQTIMYWFTKNSEPSRENAHAFLSDFLQSEVKYSNLSDERKKVYKQVVSFLKASLRRYTVQSDDAKDRNEKVYYISGGNTAIKVSRQTNEFALIADAIEGTYLVYRNRLSENDRQPIVQEVLRIVRRPPELRFEHWYRRNGRYRDSFEGAVVLIGDLVWFLGASRMTPDRFRVMNFRKLRGYPEDTRAVLWGLLLSDGTSVAADEPGACRVLLVETRDFSNPMTTSFLEEHLRFFKSNDPKLANGELIWRLVNNRVSAISEHNSTTPVLEKDGSPVVDSILRVDQVTLGKAMAEFQDEKDN